MRYTFDTDSKTLLVSDAAGERVQDLYSAGSFEAASRLWQDIGWALKYSYQFTWLGRPIIQLPTDVLRMQELIWRLQPDVIIETGIAHGGSLLLSASLCRLSGKGRVIGVDIRIRPENRAAIEADRLADLITLVEGSSTDPAVADRVRSLLRPAEKVLVLLDSMHTKDHVFAELETYAPLVTPGSYVIVADGVMRDLAGVPGAAPDWDVNNPITAAREFLARHPEFQLAPVPPAFNESRVSSWPTYWPEGFLQRVA
jgi:cephalosporin hydroxylase